MRKFEIMQNIEKAIMRVPGEYFNDRYGQFGRTTQSRKKLKGYTASTWAYRCSNALGNAAMGLPWGMFDDSGDRLEKDHPAVELFEFVNERDFWKSIIRNTTIDMNIHGYGVWFPQMAGSRIIRFKRLPAAECQLEDPNSTGENTQLVWTRGSRQSIMSMEEVVMFPLYGSLEKDPDSPMRVVIDKAYSEQKVDETGVAHFDSLGIPPYVMTSEQNVSEKDLERYDAWWRKLLEGVTRKFQVAWAGSGLKPTRMRAPLKEMELKPFRESIAKEVCAGFGVPQGIAGARETQEKATWISELVSMHHLKVIPDMELMQGVINGFMMPNVFEQPTFKFLPDEVEMLQEERTQKSERVVNEYASGLISQEAALEQLNYQKEDEGPGLVAYTQHSQAQNTPGDDIMKAIEAGKVRKKYKRLNCPDNFIWQPEHLTNMEVTQIIEGELKDAK